MRKKFLMRLCVDARKVLAGLIFVAGVTIGTNTIAYADTVKTQDDVKIEEIYLGESDTKVYNSSRSLSSSSSSGSSSSSSDEWYFNTGTSLPQMPNYSKTAMNMFLEAGDILYESSGFAGLTGHIAIIEGVFWNKKYSTWYVRLIEARLNDGVTRAVLDDDRLQERGGRVYRVTSASKEKRKAAVNFCIKQLGKDYYLDLGHDTSEDEKDWYCSELVWAAYKNQGIDIEKDGGGTPKAVSPRDVRDSELLERVKFK